MVLGALGFVNLELGRAGVGAVDTVGPAAIGFAALEGLADAAGVPCTIVADVRLFVAACLELAEVVLDHRVGVVGVEASGVHVLAGAAVRVLGDANVDDLLRFVVDDVIEAVGPGEAEGVGGTEGVGDVGVERESAEQPDRVLADVLAGLGVVFQAYVVPTDGALTADWTNGVELTLGR